ncbi:MAG: radical SAM protein, partial [Roseobacter sp.]
MPRYTSYPPANRFVEAEGALRQVRWLRAVPHGATVSLYVHVPYCETLCRFCACRTQAADEKGAVARYVSILLQEIAQVRAQLPASVFLSRLHMGGGTPTILPPEQMQLLLDTIYEAFPRAEGFECSIEIDTTNVTAEMIDCLMANGMNRAIVGIQDFDEKVQQAIGRRQRFDQTLEVICQMRRAGLKYLDMELLYGLPRQSGATIAETAQQVLALDPDRIAVCEYAHVPNLAKRQILIDARYLPSAEDAFQMSRIARSILLSDGYEALGMDHFVRPGDNLIKARSEKRLKRDFQGYSDNASHALIGLGASAIS